MILREKEVEGEEREKSQGLKKAKILYRVVKVSRIMIGSDTKSKYFLKG